MSAYAELAVTTNFSFLRGASHAEELVARAKELGLAGLGIADRNSVAGVVRAHEAAKEAGVKLIVGARLVFADGTPDILAYPQDRAAWGRLTTLLTIGKRRAEKGDCILRLDDLLAHVEGLQLIVMEASTPAAQQLPPPLRGRSTRETRREGGNFDRPKQASTPLPIPPPQGGREQDAAPVTVFPSPLVGEGGDPRLDRGEPGEGESRKLSARTLAPSPALRRIKSGVGHPLPRGERELASFLLRLRAAAPRAVWLGAAMLYRGDDHRRLARLASIAADAAVPLIAVGDVLYHAPERRALQDVVTCIRAHLTLDTAGRRLEANAERHLKSAEEMIRIFRHAPETVAATLRFLERCRFSLDELAYDYPDETREGFATPQDALVAFAEEGARRRYPHGIPLKVRHALDHEFALIAELNYAPYFLTVHDIVRFARAQNILCQGRGSAANSAVCYCLGITEVDPERSDLLFERFVSAERREPPDIDVDFEHERREEVIQYIYRRYGRERAGLAATVICYRARSAIREVGKVFGLSDDSVGALAGTLWGWSAEAVSDKEARRVGLDPCDARLAKVLTLARELIGFPRHLSQHVGGFVITRGRLDDVVPIENAAMEDRTVIEWDKDDLDSLRILKIDVLGLGMLTCLRRGLDFLQRHYGKAFELPPPLRGREQDAPLAFFPSPLAGEGGEVERSETEPGEGENRKLGVKTHAPSPALRRIKSGVGHPLPRGERMQNAAALTFCTSPRVRGEVDARAEASASSEGAFPHTVSIESPPHPARISDSRHPLPASGERETTFDLSLIPAEDEAVYRMLSRADSIGVFQVESRAQMSMLPRLKPAKFYDLVIEVAIVRPGPIQGDMVHPYLRRRQGVETISYPSPSPQHGPADELEQVLGKTLGVPLFQEQAMRIAIVAAGFTPSEADKLRRAMATFRRVGTIGYFRDKLIEGMSARGYPREFAERCFHQIEGFGEYGFPESHAASFALLVYASAWMKCHYPDVFAAALLNSQPMGFYAPAQIVRDAQEHGVAVREIDVNHSCWDNTLEAASLFPAPLVGEGGEDRRSEPGEGESREFSAQPHAPSPALRRTKSGVGHPLPRGEREKRVHPRHADMQHDIRATHAVRLGFRQISGLSEKDGRAIEAARGTGFDSLRDLWLRTKLSPAVLERLAAADAFRSLGLDRRKALWAVRALRRSGDKDDLPLFARVSTPEREPDVALPPMRIGEQVVEDYRHLHLSLKAHPVSFLRADLERRGIVRNEHLASITSGRRVTVAGLVLVRQRPGSARGVIFMTLEDETAVANTIVWPQVFETFRPVVLGARLVGVTGKLQNEFGVIHVVADRLDDLTPLLRRLSQDHGCVEALANCDEVRRPIPEWRLPPRSATALAALLKDESELTDEISPAAKVCAVMPKGRNFH
jgi:error-prone DNA polymerase